MTSSVVGNLARSSSTTARASRADIPRDWSRLHAAAIDRYLDGCWRTADQLDAPADKGIKRVIDVVLSAVLLVTLSPFLLLIAYLVQRDGGSPIFGHRRIGANGHSFVCWKFRTMVRNADKVLAEVLATNPEMREEWEREYKLRNDPRITRIGRFLRTTSLDELPQLFNVLTGEMSLVGPRPIVADEVKRYGAAFHDYMRCRPGITGKWQVSGRNDVDYGTRVRLDQEYAQRWSLKNDCTILLLTVLVVIQRRGAC